MPGKRYRSVFVLLFLTVVLGETARAQNKTCVTEECHIDYGAKEYVHGPIVLGDCESCHKLVGVFSQEKHTYELARQGAELCSFCHLEQAMDKNVHEPLVTGECIGCHDPHSSEYKFFIPTQNVSELCHECHEIVTQDRKYLHGPIATGECTLCHNSHSSDYDKLLIVEPEEICFFCHEATQEELKKLEYVHQPLQEKGCIECHDPHGTNYPMILRDSIPNQCYTCHEEVKTNIQDAKCKHDVVTTEDGCVQCHTPHASSIGFGLRADPLTLCISCHDKEIETDNGKILANFKSQIVDKKFLHGPIEEKDCAACHVSHGSDHFRLLIKEYPAQFYASFNADLYQLCFECHPESRVLTKETTDLTDFRNGNMNLHFLHVNKPQRGRTCRSCHATHASNHPKLIREEVPYGKWSMPIQYKKTETGGSCFPGCHKPKVYDRNSPVIYSVVGSTILKEIPQTNFVYEIK